MNNLEHRNTQITAGSDGMRASPSEPETAETTSRDSLPAPVPRQEGILPVVLAWAGLAFATLAVLWPLGLTNRILAGVDAFTYFTPYWAYRAAELRAGHLPLWNPYLFLGVPFLANPQAAVLYPLHWPLIWLPPATALVWSALLHVWLAAGFTCTFARRSLGLSRAAAWLAGLLFGLGGFTVARIENINQLNALAWLPASLWLYDEASRSTNWRGRVRWAIALSFAIALQLLAGHTQTAFVSLVGLGLYAMYPFGKLAYGHIGRLAGWEGKRSANRQIGKTDLPTYRSTAPPITRLLPLLAILPALLLAAAQLLPSLELNSLGLRTGGLAYRQAVSFSLYPSLLAQTFLPPFGGGLAEAFGSEGYAEFVGYVGILGLVLAIVGAKFITQNAVRHTYHASRTPAPQCSASAGVTQHEALILLAAIGFLLALGAYNPLYYLLWRFVPGFDLFRAPVRWLALYALGIAGLAGLGLDIWSGRRDTPPLPEGFKGGQDESALLTLQSWRKADFPQPPTLSYHPERSRRRPVKGLPKGRRAGRAILRTAAALGLLLLIALIAVQRPPGWATLAGWAAVALAAGGLLWVGRRRPFVARAGLIALALVELWLAGRALPFAQATAPAALSLRTAPAALLAATADQSPAGRDRFLSMSDIRYDPGDLAELRALQADRLSPEAVERFVRAAKQIEVIAPNLPLLSGLPAVDGYDGGLLPTRHYGLLQALFLPPEELLPDGRLREQLRQIPDGRLLDLVGVRFIISDKQNDLWTDDVYYDLEQAAVLGPGETIAFDLSAYPSFSATDLAVVSHITWEVRDGVPVAVIGLASESDGVIQLDFGAPADTCWAQDAHEPARARVARRWPDWMGHGADYLAVIDLEPYVCRTTVLSPKKPPLCAFSPDHIRISAERENQGDLVILGLTLIDRRTGAHQAITVSPRGDFRRIHSGDVKVYERIGAPGRAWLVHGVQPVANDVAALDLLADPAFDPRTTVTVVGEVAARPAGAATSDERVTVVAYEAERIALRVEVSRPAMLVLADSFYPGWQAAVDGVPTPIWRANLMFRAVALEPGNHEVLFTYRPASWRWGVAISLGVLVTLVVAVVATGLRSRHLRKI
jgi:hypothetical protein